jgi:hypothetical protein
LVVWRYQHHSRGLALTFSRRLQGVDRANKVSCCAKIVASQGSRN